MFATRAQPVASVLSAGVQTRNMATLREIQLRLNSIKNIGKITKSMKMIASTKVNKAQRAMETARSYGATSSAVYQNANTTPLETENNLIVVSSSDRGLCGGIHSSVAKATRRFIAADTAEVAGVVVLGDKAKNQMTRSNRGDIKLSFNQIGKAIPTFAEASAAADTILTSGVKFDSATIIYNKFTSAIAYEATPIRNYSIEAFKASEKFAAYELDDAVLEDYSQFLLANNLYWALVEGHASEMSAKRNAMENATKNAGEMVDRLTMTYNRTRQAAITSELVDIITGASAL
ncbi:atp3 gamma subunit of the F1 sector of mitochondrial F1F0 ATP synthase [Entomortierella lignicola]|nr:atp3 gamma subunit of the F1 sector of mitochondrial F1F0 ATP synthase [Entomortierella lignicola]KAF9204715.1 atp3 gamma subunit of the F1 sector of mitochondrial F1F0 ATP synthase [Haplosporangium sp. Z 27]